MSSSSRLSPSSGSARWTERNPLRGLTGEKVLLRLEGKKGA